MIDQLGGTASFVRLAHPDDSPCQSGKFRLLAIGGAKRLKFSQCSDDRRGGGARVRSDQLVGAHGPGGTPAPVVDRLNKEIKTLLDSEDVQKLFEKEGSEADYVAPAEFAPFIEREIVKWGKVVKEANIKVE